MTLDYYIAAIDGIEKEATFTETEISDLSNNATGKGYYSFSKIVLVTNSRQ